MRERTFVKTCAALITLVLCGGLLTGCASMMFGPLDCEPAQGSSEAPTKDMTVEQLQAYGKCDEDGGFNTSAGSFGLKDDYPWKSVGMNSFNAKTRYYGWNCTDFVAWRINRDAGVSYSQAKAGHLKYRWGNLTPRGGNGAQWGNAGNMKGWKRVSKAVVGDIIAVKHGGIMGSSTAYPGHVAYVGAVASDGSIITENYGVRAGGYFKISATAAQIKSYVSKHWIVVMHNPKNTGITPGGSSGATQSVVAAKSYAKGKVGGGKQFTCLVKLWTRESGWRYNAENKSSGAYGIPQALPGRKMAASGKDWKTNAVTQINWGLKYIRSRYSSPCGAWAHSEAKGWY